MRSADVTRRVKHLVGHLLFAHCTHDFLDKLQLRGLNACHKYGHDNAPASSPQRHWNMSHQPRNGYPFSAISAIGSGSVMSGTRRQGGVVLLALILVFIVGVVTLFPFSQFLRDTLNNWHMQNTMERCFSNSSEQVSVFDISIAMKNS